MKILRIKAIRLVSILGVLVLSGGGAYAATSDFSQTINAGTLTTSILDSIRDVVASPSVTMSAKNFSFDCQAGGNASTGTFGTNGERVYVSNGDAADSGWNLTIAATDGATARWANGGATSHIDFNDPSGGTAGCSDGADTDSTAGQLTINPSVSTLTTDCISCTVTGVTKGSSTSFSEGSADAITLLSAAAGSDDIWRGYLTGVTMSQTIPAETPADAFTINLTLTTTAL